MKIGEKIRSIRLNQGLSQSEVEKKTGIKREYQSKIETGELDNPTYNTLKKLSCALNMTVSQVLDYSSDGSEAESFRKNQDRIKKDIDKTAKEIKEFEKDLRAKIAVLTNLNNKKLSFITQLISTEK